MTRKTGTTWASTRIEGRVVLLYWAIGSTMPDSATPTVMPSWARHA